jgi:hypothetical protein
MADEQEQTSAVAFKRGPTFPFIGLEKAVERLREFYAKAKHFEVRVSDAAADWGYAPKSSGAFQTVGALIAYGLLEDSGAGEARKIKVTVLGRRILEDERPGVREALLAEAALKPKLFAEFAELWAEGRPDDNHAISDLKFDHGFTDDSAPRFLRVFDDVIRFTNQRGSDKETEPAGERNGNGSGDLGDAPLDRKRSDKPPPPIKKGIELMSGERELTTGLLSREASFRLIVQGRVGKKEIERLIQKLELDKEILSDDESNEIEEVIAKPGGVFE